MKLFSVKRGVSVKETNSLHYLDSYRESSMGSVIIRDGGYLFFYDFAFPAG